MVDDHTYLYRPDITLDFSSPVPLYHQIATAVMNEIVTKDVPHGARVENEKSMATRLGVSRPTMRQAMQQLVDQGVVVRKQGSGTWVASPQVDRSMELTSLAEDLEKAGIVPETVILEYGIRAANEAELALLPITASDSFVSLKRLRYANGEPLALMNNLLPVNIAPSEQDIAKRGLYANLRRRVEFARAEQIVTARAATAETARHLGEKRGAPVLEVQRITFDAKGEFVEYGHHFYRGSVYSMRSTLLVPK